MRYYIQNTNAGFLGNALLFWKKGRAGYTADLNMAEQFSEDDARKICQGDPEKNKAWPVDYIDNSKAIQRIADDQYLEPENIKQF